MTEAEQRQDESPLRSDRGVTTIKDTVVSRLTGMAAGEVEGVHLGGGASRSAGGLLQSVTGSDSSSRGVSVEVGSIETAIDLKMGIDYGKNILGTVGEVRQKVTERVQNMTGLKVTELNVTISEIVFSDEGREAGDGRRQEAGAGSRTGPEFETRTMPGGELRPGASERETTPVEPRSRAHTEGDSGPVPEEEVQAEGAPVEENETRRLRIGDETTSAEDGTTTEDDARSSEEADPATAGSAGANRGDTGTARSEDETATTDDRMREIDHERVSEVEERRSEERRSRRRRRRSEDR